MLSANGQTLKGKTNIDLKITGPAASPIVGGVVTFADGAFADPINGLAFKNIAARLESAWPRDDFRVDDRDHREWRPNRRDGPYLAIARGRNAGTR